MSFAKITLMARPDSHAFEDRHVLLNEPAKIGRSVAKAKPATNNGVFDCKVLSRNHAVIWYENGHFYVQDTKSSNGTYVNNQRLSKANDESAPYEIFTHDVIQFGVEIVENTKKITHGCVIATVILYLPDGSESRECRVSMPTSGDESGANRGSFLGDTQRPGGPTAGSMTMVSGLGQVHAHEVYALANCLHEALVRESALDAKLRSLDAALNAAAQSADVGWKALLDEERLVSKLDSLEQQLSVYAALASAIGADEAAGNATNTAGLDDPNVSNSDGQTGAEGDDCSETGRNRTESEAERGKRWQLERVAADLRDRLIAMQTERAAYEESVKTALQSVLEQKEAVSRQCSDAERRAEQLETEARGAAERVDALQKQVETLARTNEERDEEMRKRETRYREEEREREAELTTLRREREKLEQLTLQFNTFRAGLNSGTGTGTRTYKIGEGSLLEALRRVGDLPMDGSKLDELTKLGVDSANANVVESGLWRFAEPTSDHDKSGVSSRDFQIDFESDRDAEMEADAQAEIEQTALRRLSDELSRILERCRIAAAESEVAEKPPPVSHESTAADADNMEEGDTGSIDAVIDEMFKLDSLDSSLTSDDSGPQRLTDSTTTINTLTDFDQTATIEDDNNQDVKANSPRSTDNDDSSPNMCYVRYETIASLKAAFDEIVDFWRKRDAMRREERQRNIERSRNIEALREELRATRYLAEERSARVEMLEAELERVNSLSKALETRVAEIERNTADQVDEIKAQLDSERSESQQRQTEIESLRSQLDSQVIATRPPEVASVPTEHSAGDSQAEKQLKELRDECDLLKKRISLIEAEAATCKAENERLAATNTALLQEASRAANQTAIERDLRPITSAGEANAVPRDTTNEQLQLRQLEAMNAEYVRELAAMRSRARQISGFAMLPVLVIVFAIMVRLCIWLSGVTGAEN